MSGLKKKQTSVTLISTADLQNRNNDQTFDKSTVSKRFSRKKNNINQSKSSLALNRYNDNLSECRADSRELNKKTKKLFKTDNFYIDITETQQKSRSYYNPSSSNRTETTYKKEKQEQRLNIGTNIDQLKEELRLKSSQIMFLQDQTMKLRRDISTREQQSLHNNIARQKEYQQNLSKYRQDIKVLNLEIKQKNKQIKQYKKTQSVLIRQIKTLKYDKAIIQKQLQQVYSKKIGKDSKDLMSYRQLSLMKQLEDLSLKIKEGRNTGQLKLEQQIYRLKEENYRNFNQICKIEIQNRILNRKIVQYERKLKQNIDTFNRYYTNLKQSQNQQADQMKRLRKQNIFLKSLYGLNHPKKKKFLTRESSEQSLSLSISTVN